MAPKLIDHNNTNNVVVVVDGGELYSHLNNKNNKYKCVRKENQSINNKVNKCKKNDNNNYYKCARSFSTSDLNVEHQKSSDDQLSNLIIKNNKNKIKLRPHGSVTVINSLGQNQCEKQKDEIHKSDGYKNNILLYYWKRLKRSLSHTGCKFKKKLCTIHT